MKIGYARVSTDDQKVDMQMDALRRAGCDTVYVDEGVSGSKTSRPELDKCLASLTRGDTLCVYKLDRLGRSTLHLINLLSDFGKNGIAFHSICESIDTNSHYGTAMFGMLSVFAQLERDVIRERVRNGVTAYIKRNGKWGRREKVIEIDASLSVSENARRCGVSRNTIYKAMK